MRRCLGLLGIALILLSVLLDAQSLSDQTNPFPTGLSLQYGLGQVALRDEYISKEKYAGPLPSISADWTRFHEKWGYRILLEFHNSSEIKNHRVSADVIQAALQHDYLYPAGMVPLFGQETYLYVGPSFGLYFFLNQQNIASQGALHADMSMLMQLSLGVNAQAIIPIGPKLLVEGSGWANVLAVGARSTDPIEEAGVTGGLLNGLSGTQVAANAGVRYQIQDHLSVKLGGMVQILRLSKWTPLLVVSDNLILTLSFNL